MLEEIGIDNVIINTILDKSFSNAVRTDKEGGWWLKILSYSDMRVVPAGITSLDRRIKDLFERLDKYKNRPDINDLIGAMKHIEKDIQSNVAVSLESIPNELKQKEINSFLDLEI